MESFQYNQTNKKVESLDDLPHKYREIFHSYTSFNTVQTQALDYIFNSNNSIVIVAPTGSGKTVILELAIIKLLMTLEGAEFKRDFKVVYICPVKALCRERYHDWAPRFESLGVTCAEITGDDGDYFSLQGYNLIITTPEKWDSLTRKWRDNAGLVQLVKLFMIDEVHLLSDNQRGPVLEAIVCRMKTISATLKLESVRFVAISATIYNVEDLAAWLGTKEAPAHYYKFGNEVRPVQLQKIVKGYNSQPGQSSFLFDIQLSYKLKTLILEYSKGKPCLIFCSTRKSVLQTSKILSEQLTFHFTESQLKNISEGSNCIGDNKLKELVLTGIGYHHAGLSANDRHSVQNLFVSGNLPILVATSTLAMGVNLPAHLVIIKSTQQYKAGHIEEYSESSILQMIGRAGRPQFDTSAVAIIMTRFETVAKYQRLLDSKEILESSLHLHLPEHLNSEIVLYTITDLSVAMEWIRCTFLYVRAIKNPKYYGFDYNATPSRVEKNLEIICLKEINGLKRAELIEVSDNGMDISPTPNGRLMSHFYLSFETFKIFLQIKGTESLAEILSSLSEAHEFSEIQLRVNERRTLNELNRNKNRDTIRFQLPGKIKTRAMKVNCLIQACLGCLCIQDPALYQESIRIVKTAERLAKCLSEFLTKKFYYQSVLNTVLLAKCLHAKLWENSRFVCRQLERIGPTLGALLESCGKTSFAELEKSNPRDLERILNRAPPFGNHLQEAVYHLPKYKLIAETTHLNSTTFQTNITVTLLNPDVISKKNTAGDHHRVALIVGDTDNNLLSFSRFTDRILIQKNVQVSVLSKFPNLPHKIIANVVSEEWIGIDVNTEVIICPQVQTKVVGPTPGPPAKKKKKTEGTKKPVLPKEFDFLKKYKREEVEEIKPVEPKNKNDFVACFDVDIEILDDPEGNNEKVTLPTPLEPSLTLPKPLNSSSILHSSGTSDINPKLPSSHSQHQSYPPLQTSKTATYRCPNPSLPGYQPSILCLKPVTQSSAFSSRTNKVSSFDSLPTKPSPFYSNSSYQPLSDPLPSLNSPSYPPPLQSLQNHSQPSSIISSESQPQFCPLSSQLPSQSSVLSAQPTTQSYLNYSQPPFVPSFYTPYQPQQSSLSSPSPTQSSVPFSNSPPGTSFHYPTNSSFESQFPYLDMNFEDMMDVDYPSYSPPRSSEFSTNPHPRSSLRSPSPSQFSMISSYSLPKSSLNPSVPSLQLSNSSFQSSFPLYPFSDSVVTSSNLPSCSLFSSRKLARNSANSSYSAPESSQQLNPESSSHFSVPPLNYLPNSSPPPSPPYSSRLSQESVANYFNRSHISPQTSPKSFVNSPPRFLQFSKQSEPVPEVITIDEENPKEVKDGQRTPERSLITLENIYEALVKTKGYSISNSAFGNNEHKPNLSDSGFFSESDSDLWKKYS